MENGKNIFIAHLNFLKIKTICKFFFTTRLTYIFIKVDFQVTLSVPVIHK